MYQYGCWRARVASYQAARRRGCEVGAGVALRRFRAAGAITASAVVVLASMIGTATSASAAPPVYQITGQWATGTPTSTATGKLVTAVWRVNVNDSANPPANDDVDNVHFSVTAAHGRFTEIPTPCQTRGVTPVSGISTDGTRLDCNLGTVTEGTAEVVQAPMVVNGQTGDEISATGAIAGQTADVPPIPIVGTFGEDMLWGTPSSYRYTTNATAPTDTEFDLEWTLRTTPGSDPGPDSVTYNLTVTQNPSSGPQRTLTVGAPQVPRAGCSTYTLGGYPAPGHPLSGRPDAPSMNAPFVTTCTLTRIDNTHFRLTLTGIDYSKTTLPTEDSARKPLPTNWDAVASGSVWFTLHGMTAATGITLTASSPTYRSTTGKTFTDAASNNTSTKTLTLPGDWSTSWTRTFTRSGGTTWDNSYQVPQGTVVRSTITDYYGRESAIPNNSIIAECDILDRKYVTFNAVAVTKNPHNDGTNITPLAATVWYYTGAGDAAQAKYLLPNNPAYDPNAFRGCDGNVGWTTTRPANGQILAVRATWRKSSALNMDAHLQVDVAVAANAPIGVDVWTLGATKKGSTAAWNYPGRQTTSGYTPVPGSRYHYTDGARDVLHVTGPTPVISKSANPRVVTPGVPATFALRYQMKGRAGLTFNNVRIVDTLPAGMTYAAGSAKPAPTTVNGQTLTWVLNAVPSNTLGTITYQASVAGVPAGQAVTNNVTMTYGSQSAKSSAQVTVATSGYTSILKTADQLYIPNPNLGGTGTGTWTITVRSFDPVPQTFTDVIDVLPYNGDGRGTSFSGSYTVGQITPPAGSTVYYTTANPSTLSDDPGDPSNGSAGSIANNTVGWSQTYDPNATAIRVIGGALAPGATQAFKVSITNSGAKAGDTYVNRAQGRAGHTQLVMRTSAELIMSPVYSYTIKKYVQDSSGTWHDANGLADAPTFRVGDTVHYRITVTNTGSETLQNLKVTDDKYGADGSFTIATLDSLQSTSHEYSEVIGANVASPFTNTACAVPDGATLTSCSTGPDGQCTATSTGGSNGLHAECDPAMIQIYSYSVSKMADPASGTAVTPGQTVKYTVKVTNTGDTAASAMVTDALADVLDDATYNNDAKADIGTFQYSDGTLGWSGTVPVGGAATLTYSVTVKTAAQLAAGNGNGDLVNTIPGCSSCTTRNPVGWFTFDKTADPESGAAVAPGQKITYTIAIVQHGAAALTDASVTDDLSDVVDDATYNNDVKASSGTATVKSDRLGWSGDLAVGQTVTVTYSVTVHATPALSGSNDELHNPVTSTDKRGLCDQAVGCITDHKVGWFTYDKTADPASGTTVDKGATVAYTITITQHGAAALTDASVTDDLSDVVDDATYNNDVKASSGTATVKSATLDWSGDLAVAQTVTVTYSVTVSGDGNDDLVNPVTSTDGRGSCDESVGCRTVHPVRKPAVAGTGGSGGGGNLSYTGTDLPPMLATGSGLLLIGGLLLLIDRRRRRTS